MNLFLYNTLTKTKESFKPLDENLVAMYVCGPTVYDRPHIGNARSVVVYDILYRILIQIFGQNHVKYVRNITDVDDKIIDRAEELQIKISDLTLKTTLYFHEDMEYLSCLRPTIEPKATDHIIEMIEIIQKLIDLGHAYIANQHVYFDILSAKNYTKLSGRTIDEMIHGVRIEKNESKKYVGDFVLWKPQKNGEDIDANFASPWGIGRPGWHIECSAMSYKYLGENFDIHGGGSDLIFPHHTNEIAQSTCAFPQSQFAKFWIHNGFLTVGDEKMSKSLGNFITIADLIEKNLPSDVIRLFFLSVHYRKPLDYNEKAISDASKMIDYWYRALESVNLDTTDEEKYVLPDEFLTALFDDMNTPLSIKIINDYAKLIHSSNSIEDKEKNAKRLLASANFIGLLQQPVKDWFHSKSDNIDIDELIKERAKHKAENNWLEADKIRNDLLARNIILEDIPNGFTIWRKRK